MANDSVMDERTFREIYLTGFEIAVKEGQPKTIISAYNNINGVYANESKHLLQDVLVDDWGYQGAVVTDWGGSTTMWRASVWAAIWKCPAPAATATGSW